MPLVPLTTLPDAARMWVFGSVSPLAAPVERALLHEIDVYLAQWTAHGAPLTVGRDWCEHRFLAIAVDMSAAMASGCSLDGLFRVLRQLDAQYGSSLVGGGRVYYRDSRREIRCVDRDTFTTLTDQGVVTSETVVFDVTVATLGDWRTRFETVVRRSWHSTLLPASAG